MHVVWGHMDEVRIVWAESKSGDFGSSSEKEQGTVGVKRTKAGWFFHCIPWRSCRTVAVWAASKLSLAVWQLCVDNWKQRSKGRCPLKGKSKTSKITIIPFCDCCLSTSLSVPSAWLGDTTATDIPKIKQFPLVPFILERCCLLLQSKSMFSYFKCRNEFVFSFSKSITEVNSDSIPVRVWEADKLSSYLRFLFKTYGGFYGDESIYCCSYCVNV